MKFVEFKSSLERKQLDRNYLLFGSDSYLLNQARDLLFKAIKEKLGTEISFRTIELGDVSIEDVLNAAQHVPMFAPQQLILVKGFMKLRNNQVKKLEEYLKKPSKSTFLIFWTGELAREDKEKRVFRVLGAGTRVVEMSPLDEGEAKRWIGSKFKAAGFSIDADAIDLLQESQGNNLQRLSHEIEKLMLFAGAEKSVTAAAVTQSQGFSREHNINEFLGAILGKEKVKALRLLNEMMSDNSEVIPMISLLSRQLRQLLQIREMSGKSGIAEIGKQVGVYNQFVVEKMMTQARRFSSHSLSRAINGLALLDDRVKRSSLDTRLFAELLVHELTN
jgi:DNA polymerase III subunit delta